MFLADASIFRIATYIKRETVDNPR